MAHDAEEDDRSGGDRPNDRADDRRREDRKETPGLLGDPLGAGREEDPHQHKEDRPPLQ